MYERLRIDVKVERGFSFLRLRTTFHTLPLYISFTHVKITREWKSALTQNIRAIYTRKNKTRLT